MGSEGGGWGRGCPGGCERRCRWGCRRRKLPKRGEREVGRVGCQGWELRRRHRGVGFFGGVGGMRRTAVAGNREVDMVPLLQG